MSESLKRTSGILPLTAHSGVVTPRKLILMDSTGPHFSGDGIFSNPQQILLQVFCSFSMLFTINSVITKNNSTDIMIEYKGYKDMWSKVFYGRPLATRPSHMWGCNSSAWKIRLALKRSLVCVSTLKQHLKHPNAPQCVLDTPWTSANMQPCSLDITAPSIHPSIYQSSLEAGLRSVLKASTFHMRHALPTQSHLCYYVKNRHRDATEGMMPYRSVWGFWKAEKKGRKQK